MTRLIGTSDAGLDAVVSALAAHPTAPPGVCVATSIRGRVNWTSTGVAQAFDNHGPLADTPPMDLDTRSDVGSLTKILATTSSLMSLVAAGRLDLSGRLSDLLPALAARPVGAATVASLLRHRAGLWEWWPTYLESGDPLEFVAGLPLRYPPDRDRHYSDLGFMLLGAAIEAVTAEPLADTVSRLVTAPFELVATTFAVPRPGGAVAASSTGDRFERDMVESGSPYPVTADATGFRWRSHVLVGEINDGNAFHSFGSIAGHAGLFSTAGDLLRFGDALLDCLDGRGQLPGDVVRTFFEPGPDPLQALGFRMWQAGPSIALGHTGYPGVAMAVLPDRHTTVVLVTNRLHVTGPPVATDQLWTEVLDAVVHERPAA